MSDEQTQDYEAPKVEQVETEDAPAVTAAGHDTHNEEVSDSALKRSVRGLEEALTRLR